MKINTRPIVIGVIDKQPTALRFALREAKRTGRALRVVHSAGVPAGAATLYGGVEMFEDLRDAGQVTIDAAPHFIEQEAPDIQVDYVLTMVSPAETLKLEADQASLLVLGSDTHAWPDRLLGGTVSSDLALHAACPVVVVPERAYPTPLSGGVVVAVDGETSADGPLQFAFEQADAEGAVLHVLHARQPAETIEDTQSIRTNVAELLAGWSGEFPDVRLVVDFPLDHANEACVRATEHSELVVIGRSHSHALPFALARPLAAEVLRHAHCPVAVVPANYPKS